MMAAAESILASHNLSKTFGGVKAVNDVSLTLCSGEILGLIGPNGAGKSTLINLLSGLSPPDRGTVIFAGQDVTSMGPEQRTRRGLLRTFQQLRAFRTFTVEQSLAVASQAPRARTRKGTSRSAAINDVARRFGLVGLMGRQMSELPYGTQKIVNLALVSLNNPQVLLLDEPFAGVVREDVLRLSRIVRDFAEQGVGVCLVEHDMEAVMQTCERILVLDAGALIFDGTPDAVRTNAEVRRVYLGSRDIGTGKASDGQR
jgi:branched-chain amino acid transport system ATP-binding protein